MHLRVEALYAHLQLQYSGRELHHQHLEAVGQMVGDDLEVHKQFLAHAVQKKLKDAGRGFDFQIEGAVYKLEVTRAAPKQRVHLGQESFQVKGDGGLVQRAQTKLTLEGATTRSLDIQQAVGQVIVGVVCVWQGNAV